MGLLEQIEYKHGGDQGASLDIAAVRFQKDDSDQNSSKHSRFCEHGDQEGMEVAVLISRKNRLGFEERITVANPDQQLFGVFRGDFETEQNELHVLTARTFVERQTCSEHPADIVENVGA